MRVAKSALVYFLLVFGAGFVLGVLRERWLKDAVGARAAEIAEVPVMIGISALAALWVVRRYGLRHRLLERLLVGAFALLLLLAAEVTIVLFVRGETLERYLDTRDAVAFPAFLIGLLCFALMPALVRGKMHSRSHSY